MNRIFAALSLILCAAGLFCPASALTSVQRDFEQGQSHLQRREYLQAARCLRRIPPADPLFPAALRGVLYCARVCPQTDLAELADFCAAALPARSELLHAAGDSAELRPIVELIEIMQRRRDSSINSALIRARALENDESLSPVMRRRIRLEIAELYYAKEKLPPPPGKPPTEDDETDDSGKGEETLLQFISANPDSPLLREAFRRLQIHGDLLKSEYTFTRLNEWAQDTANARRAALSLLALVHRCAAAGGDTSGFANKALAELPTEPLTKTILQEHVNTLQTRGAFLQARPYLSFLNSPETPMQDARTLFLLGIDAQETPSQACDFFLRCARAAQGPLHTAAMINALVCAMRAGDAAQATALLDAGRSSEAPAVLCALLLTHAQLLPPEQAHIALSELDEAMSLSPAPQQAIDLFLEQKRFEMYRDPQAALQSLMRCRANVRTDEQELYYAALVENCARRISPDNAGLAAGLLSQLIKEAGNLRQREALTFHTAAKLSAAGEHATACRLLQQLLPQQPAGQTKAITHFYAGREYELCGTLPSLKRAVALYAECAAHENPLRTLAVIRRAAVLSRINRTEEALSLLSGLNTSRLDGESAAHYYTVLADCLAFSGAPQADANRALNACEQIYTIAGISPLWHLRSLLQHAAVCTRFDKGERALQDYREVMRRARIPDGTDAQSSPHVLFYYYAGAGVVYHLLQTGQYAEAARTAEEAAVWPGTGENPAPADPARAAFFSRWAQTIRQVHFVPQRQHLSDEISF